MRSGTIILSIFLMFKISNGSCSEKLLLGDTTRHASRKHRLKYSTPHVSYSLPDSLLYYKDCVFTNKYSAAQRLGRYPFNKAAKVLAVSFQNGAEPNVEITTDGQSLTRKHKPYGLLIKKNKLDPSSLFELRKLSRAQIDRLSDLMYNTDFKVHFDQSKYADPGTNCYEPRNAFLFIDRNGKVFDYIEMYFQCSGSNSGSGKISLSVGCNKDLDIAKKLLMDIGIRFGTTTRDDNDFQNNKVSW